MKKLLTLSVLFFFICQNMNAETEPNDNSNQANILNLNVTVDGVLSGSDVDDWYILTVPEGGILSFKVNKTGTGNARVYMLDADRVGYPEITNLYLGYSESPPEGWTITYPVLPGRYYFHFLRYDPSVAYTITPTVAISNFGQDMEPNHIAGDAQVFSSVGSVGGTLRYYRPNEGTDITDWFKMVVPQGAILNIKVHKKGPGNTWIRMRDAELSGFPEISNFYTGYSDSPAEGWTWSFPVLAGTYFFVVSEGENWLDYRMEATLVPPVYAEDVEPNNTYGEAGSFKANDAITGTLRYYGPGEGWDLKDYYKMTVPAGGILNVRVHKSGPGNSWIRLRDGELPNNPEISNFYTGYSNSPAEGWNWIFPVLEGDYYFQIEEGELILDYKLDALLPKPIWGEDAEPNDSLKYARQFAVNDSIGGLMGYYHPGTGYDNWDWFEINTTEAGLLSFNIIKLGAQNGNVRFRDKDSEIGSVYLGFGDQTASFSKLVPAGKYYMGFEKFGGDYQYKVVSRLLPAPVADFTFSQTGNAFAFENTTLHEASYVWKFDDGATATTVNAYHEYKAPGNFNVCLIATNPAGSDTMCHTVILPGVARILPAMGGNTGDLTVQIFGGGLDTFYIAKIMKGNTVIATSSFTDFAGKSSINVQFDLRNKAIGTYDFRIEKLGGPSYVLTDGFKIIQGVAADPWVRISGRNRILFNTWTTYTLEYGNNGNVDATFVPIWLTFSKNPGLDVKFEKVKFIDPEDKKNQIEIPGDIYTELDSIFGKPNPSRVYPLYMRRIPGNSSGSINIKVKTSGDLKINAWAEKPWFQSPVDEDRASCIADALTDAPPHLAMDENKADCAKLLFIYLALEFVGNEEYEKPDDPLGLIPVIAALKVATKTCGVTDPEDRKELADWVTEVILNGWLKNIKSQSFSALPVDVRDAESCSTEFEPQNLSGNTLSAVNSLDPNEKSGVPGYGAENYNKGTRSLPYTIDFENKASASAPAHTVTILDTLDKSKFDLNSFFFGKITIGDSIIQPEPGLKELVLDKRLDKLGVTVRIQGKLDLQTGIVEWVLRSLDAATLAEVEDPDVGFLPPNVNAPEGQGSVSFFIQTKNAPQNGEKIRNDASIVFDANPAILTNEYLITFDLEAPSSKVLPLPPTTHNEQFTVSWSGQDAGSGIQLFDIWVSENNKEDSLWLSQTTLSSAEFKGYPGRTYKFYSIAVDHVGNVEAAPTLADAEISILVGTEDAIGGNGIIVFPNPASDLINFRFLNESSGLLALYRQDGVPVFYSRLAGESEYAYSTAGLSRGVYLWKWLAQDGTTMAIGKIILVQQLN